MPRDTFHCAGLVETAGRKDETEHSMMCFFWGGKQSPYTTKSGNEECLDFFYSTTLQERRCSELPVMSSFEACTN